MGGSPATPSTLAAPHCSQLPRADFEQLPRVDAEQLPRVDAPFRKNREFSKIWSFRIPALGRHRHVKLLQVGARPLGGGEQPERPQGRPRTLGEEQVLPLVDPMPAKSL